MTKKIKDLAVAVDSYIKDGKKKNRYLNIGCILEDDKGGKFMLLDRSFNPAGIINPDNRSTIMVSMFDVDGKKEETSHKGFDKQGDVVSSAPEETIPF